MRCVSENNVNILDSGNSSTDDDDASVVVALYVSTSGEGPIPHKRIKQLSEGRNISNLNRIFTHCVHTIDDLLKFLESLRNGKIESHLTSIMSTSSLSAPKACSNQSSVLSRVRLGVLVIDSIGGLFRGEHNENVHLSTITNRGKEYIQRAGTLFDIASQLKHLSFIKKMPIVTINQVSANFDAHQSKREVKAALGLSWSCCVNARFMLTRKEELMKSSSENDSSSSSLPSQNLGPQSSHSLHSHSSNSSRGSFDSMSAFRLQESNRTAANKMKESNRGNPQTKFRRHIHVIFSPELSDDTTFEFRIRSGGIYAVK